MKKNVHTNVIRYIIALLVLCLMIPLAVACADDSGNNGGNKPSGNGSVGGSSFEKYNVADNLPDSYNYNETFTILYFLETAVQEYFINEDTGSVIDGAVFDAIANTEERFGVTIEAIGSGAANEGAHVNMIRTEVSSGSTDWDIARVHDTQGGNLSLDGTLIDLYTLPNLDFSKPWWPQETVESLSFMGQMYLASSSMSYRGLNSTTAVFFNKGLLEDYEMSAPYELVQNKEWYLEDMFTMLEDIYVPGEEGIEDKSDDDTFGIVIPSQLYAWQECFGIELVKKEDDKLVLNGADIRVYDLVEKMYNVLFDNDGGYVVTRATAAQMFGQNQALYIPISLGYAISDFRNYENLDYGIVPMPMLDEDQGQYYASYTDRYFVVPSCCPDKEFVGTILESMSAEGYRVVTPIYFEVALKNRYTRDEISKEMVDLIKDSMILDFSYVYGNDKWWSRSLYSMFAGASPNKDYASYYAGLFEEAETRVGVVVDAFKKMKAQQESAE